MHIKKKIAFAAAAAAAAAVTAGCSEDSMNLGNKWVDPGTDVIIIDTCTVEIGFTDSDGTSLQTGSLTYGDMMFPESTYYTYDITDFINSQFGKIGINKQFLQLLDPSYGYTLDELVIGDMDLGVYNIKLEIQLAVYNE